MSAKSPWIEHEDPLECGVLLPMAIVNAAKRERACQEWLSGETLRAIAARHGVSFETVRKWTAGLGRTCGACRRPKRKEVIA